MRLAAALWCMIGAAVAGVVPLHGGPAVVQTAPRTLLVDGAAILRVRQALDRHDARLAAPLSELRRLADAVTRQAPVSVTEKTAAPPSGDKRDYMSLAPYWWPNHAAPDGLPYVLRDGYVNPERRAILDEAYLDRTISAVRILAFAFFFTGERVYAEHAVTMLRVFFLDPATRMNPNLTYAQLIRGRPGPNPSGIIESRDLAVLADAVELLPASPHWTAADRTELHRWFDRYLDWLVTSEAGRLEGRSANNHRSFYDQQVIAIALFSGRTDLAREKLRDARDEIIPRQIEPDGRQPRELRRTRSWHYSAFNLEALLRLVALSGHAGGGLGVFSPPDGRRVRAALDYLVPYAVGEKTWPFQEIGPWTPSVLVPLLLQASAEFGAPQYRDGAKRIDRRATETSWLNLLYSAPGD